MFYNAEETPVENLDVQEETDHILLSYEVHSDHN